MEDLPEFTYQSDSACHGECNMRDMTSDARAPCPLFVLELLLTGSDIASRAEARGGAAPDFVIGHGLYLKRLEISLRSRSTRGERIRGPVVPIVRNGIEMETTVRALLTRTANPRALLTTHEP